MTEVKMAEVMMAGVTMFVPLRQVRHRFVEIEVCVKGPLISGDMNKQSHKKRNRSGYQPQEKLSVHLKLLSRYRD
jgi:hypothetical protein